MPRVYLDAALCSRARDKMDALLEAADEKGISIQHKAADSLLRACLTQERYGLNPQTPADFQRATTSKNSTAQQLANLSEEDVLEMQAQMTQDYPGKPS